MMQIEMMPTARLVPYARNARTHSDQQVAQIAASMAEFGFVNPILIGDDDVIIAGHGRLMAAQRLGMTDVPTIVLGHLTDAQRRALVIADNKIGDNAGWDDARLLQELQALQDEGFDLDLLGIPDDELAALLAVAEDRPEISDEAADAIPEPPAEPITRPGDIWALGKHRLCCGDATNPAAVTKLMRGDEATLMFTSPPYAQQRDYGSAKEKVGDWDALMQGVFAAAPVTADAQVLVNLGMVHRDSEWQPYWEGWIEWMRAQGWRRFGWYVWDQGPGLPGDWQGRLAPSHEFIFHFNRAPRKPHKTVPTIYGGQIKGGKGLRRADGTIGDYTAAGSPVQDFKIPDSVIRIMRHKGGLGAAGSHPAVFPVALVEFVLTAFSDPGDLIYEPFCGSGTQIVAAERAGRRCFAMELDPVYCDVAVRRWEIATGKAAERSSLEEAAA